MEQRSSFVTVIGCVFIALSSLFLLESLAFMLLPRDVLLPLTQPIQLFSPGDTLYLSFARGMFLVLGAVSAWVLLSAIGLLLRKSWVSGMPRTTAPGKRRRACRHSMEA